MAKKMSWRRLAFIVPILAVLALLPAAQADAAFTLETITWNIIGLDSNNPSVGPNRFPVGARVCSTTAVTDVVVDFVWDSTNSYIYLRPGSQSSITIPSIAAGGCADAYFEVEVDRDAAAFDTTRRYHITAGGASTPTPQELYVEHLISQSRNYITDITVDGVSIPAGGYVNLVVGQTYTIELYGGTATQGYNQFEEFIDFPNTIFQILSVNTDYSANDSPYVSDPDDKLYADACLWENDPNSPYYRSCVGGGYKSGGSSVVTTYSVKIISGGGTTQTLNTLLHDFSGSSFHYNADYSTEARFANIIDPTTVTISKSFNPDPTNAGGVSALTFTLSNPNGGAVNGVSFTDNLPTSPATMVVANPPNATTNGCGTATFTPSAGDTTLSFSNGSIAAYGNCTVKVNVSPPATGTYTNVSNNLYVGSVDTGDNATDTLTVNNAPPPPSPVCTLVLAEWSVPPGTANPPVATSQAADVATATASAFIPTSTLISSSGFGDTASWQTYGYKTDGQYIEFVVDTSNFTEIFMSFYVANPSPANGPTQMVLSYDNGAGFTDIYTVASPALAFTLHSVDFTGLTSTTGNTTFRLRASGAKNNKSGASLDYDNITFTGCGVPSSLTISKDFSPNPVAVNATSTLTFTVTNPNYGLALSGIAFTDTLPSGLTVASGSSTQCGGTFTTTSPDTISFSGGTLASGASCTIATTVTATTAGPHDNVSGFVSSSETGTNTESTGIATASLSAVSPPSISKQFDANPILAGGVSTLTFIITNPNQDDALSGVAFSDTFPTSPASMVVAPTPNATTSGCGTPTFTPTAGDASISFSDGSIAAGSSCTVTVDVTAPTIGTYDNTSGYVSHQISAAIVNGNTASDSLSVNPPSPQIQLLKQVGPSDTGPWTSYLAIANAANVYYKFTIENAGDAALSSIGITDPQVDTTSCTWTDPLPVPAPDNENHITTCVVGPITAVAGLNSNTATASGTYGGSTYTDTSTAVYATTALTIDKSATESYFTATGDVLHYSFIVNNTGYATLEGPVTVADNKATDESCPDVSTVGDGDNYLEPGESVTCTATYTVVDADVTAKSVTNVATATVDGVTSAPDTVIVSISGLTVLKFVTAYSDPFNGTTNPKAIPGAEMVYTIRVTNTGLVETENITVTDAVPTNTELFVGDLNGAGSGPVRFINGTTDSGLTYIYNALDDDTDDIAFSDDNGATYGYHPTADTDGYDANVTDIKVTPTGIFNASDGVNDPYFDLLFKVRVK